MSRLVNHIRDDDFGIEEYNSDSIHNIGDDLHSQTELLLTVPIDNNDEDSSEQTHKNIRLSCCAHSLQLPICGGLKDEPCLPGTSMKFRKFSKKAHKSMKITDLRDDVNRELKKIERHTLKYRILTDQTDLPIGRAEYRRHN
jgi:hypothetical protein